MRGHARFLDTHLAVIEGDDTCQIAFDTAFIATGSASRRIDCLPWASGEAEEWLYDGDTIQKVGRVPERLLIQGGGTIGVEYAFIFRSLGSEVTVAYREQVRMSE